MVLAGKIRMIYYKAIILGVLDVWIALALA